MNPEDLAKILDEIGNRIGPAGERVFQIAVQYQILSGLVTLGVGLVFLTATILLGRRGFINFRGSKDREVRDEERTSRETWAMVQSAGAVLAGFFTLFFIPYSLIQILNPEYSAITNIIGAIRGR